MTDADKPTFLRIFAEWTSMYPSATLHEGMPTAYWNHLRALPLEAVRRALVQSTKASPQWLPTAETVRQFAEVEAKRLHEPVRRPLLSGAVEPDKTPETAKRCAAAIEAHYRALGLDGEGTTPRQSERARKYLEMIRKATGLDLRGVVGSGSKDGAA